MIATVRIAPMEMWCGSVPVEICKKVVGMLIEIDAASMIEGVSFTDGTNGCSGKHWLVTLESVNKVREAAGLEPWPEDARPIHFCEHMLEMD